MRFTNHTMQEALRLVKAGDLQAATQAIQRSLREQGESTRRDPSGTSADIEGTYRVVPEPSAAAEPAPRTAEPVRPDAGVGPGGEFRDHHFKCDTGALRYKLFIPHGLRDAAPPLLVMLHGCTQSPDDFARGTRMNALAQEQGYVVAYPAQSQRNNANRCWNWFRGEDQRRGQGEPAIIAALARDLIATRGLDERRVYVAGLSAGGAMAAVLASLYPDVFAAIGVHSGLPFGVAHDLPSAFTAMKHAAGGCAAGETARNNAVPAIVFHGDRDTTVDHRNGAAVIAQFRGVAGTADGAEARAARATVEAGSVPGGRSYTRTIHTNPDGCIVAEHWVVHGAGHAWSGGDPKGSFTDRSGPDASKQMLRFFSACVRVAAD